MSTEPHDIDQLILNVLSGKASEDEFQQFKNWLNESKEHRNQFEILEMIWKEKSREPQIINAEDIQNDIWQKGVNYDQNLVSTTKQKNIGFYLKIASVIAIFIVSSFMIITYFKQENTKEPIAIQNLTIKKENPAGQKSKIILPDGSKVWLNSLSSITYQKNFNADQRLIELVGEAYFEVKEDPTKPFVVNSGNLKTMALGTSFNISAYPQDEFISVALLTGKVKVSNVSLSFDDVYLEPQNGLSYSKKDNTITRKIISDNVMAWKDGILIFNGENYFQFIRKIEKWYDVEVETTGEVPNDWNIRASFDNEYLSNIMNSVSFNKNFTYQLEDNKLFINFK